MGVICLGLCFVLIGGSGRKKKRRTSEIARGGYKGHTRTHAQAQAHAHANKMKQHTHARTLLSRVPTKGRGMYICHTHAFFVYVVSVTAVFVDSLCDAVPVTLSKTPVCRFVDMLLCVSRARILARTPAHARSKRTCIQN